MMTSSSRGAITVNPSIIGRRTVRVLLQLSVGNAVGIMRLENVHLRLSSVQTVPNINLLILPMKPHIINAVLMSRRRISYDPPLTTTEINQKTRFLTGDMLYVF